MIFDTFVWLRHSIVYRLFIPFPIIFLSATSDRLLTYEYLNWHYGSMKGSRLSVMRSADVRSRSQGLEIWNSFPHGILRKLWHTITMFDMKVSWDKINKQLLLYYWLMSPVSLAKLKRTYHSLHRCFKNFPLMRISEPAIQPDSVLLFIKAYTNPLCGHLIFI